MLYTECIIFIIFNSIFILIILIWFDYVENWIMALEKSKLRLLEINKYIRPFRNKMITNEIMTRHTVLMS